jgi:RNA polymerase sigma-70 factor (ECF subfamily)
MSARSNTHPAPEPAAEPSFDELYRTHARTVARWAAHLGGPRIDVDESVQAVFMIVTRRLGEFRGDAKVTTWLFRITARVVANQRRQLRRRGIWVRLTKRVAEETPATGPSPAEALEGQQAGTRFYRLLEALPEHHRQVLLLFELEEMSTDEIARLIERPSSTVRVWLHRARAELGRRWENDGTEQEEDA